MQQKLPIIVLIAVILSFGGGYLTAESMNDSKSDSALHVDNHMDAHTDAADTMHMDHVMYEVESENAPTVKVTVTEDEKSGWNVHLDTTNYTFTPEAVNTDNALGEGHAHLYVNDEKIARLYGNDFHYDGTFDGEKSFRVTLNANDHSEYATNGAVIQDTVVVTHNNHE